MGYPKIVEDAKGVMNLNFYAYSVRSLSCDVHHYRTTTSRLAHLQQPVHCLSFLITRTLKQDDLAAAFSANFAASTRTELLEWTCRRKQHEFNRGNSEVFLFCSNTFSADKTSKKIDIW